MSIEVFAAFCVAATVVIVMPGPIVSLVVANSLGHGTRIGLATVAGSCIGNMALAAVAVAGLGAMLALLAELFDVIRWLGAGYLIWLGVKAWRSGRAMVGEGKAVARQRRSLAAAVQGVMIAITNPKAFLFYGAFFPQFIDPARPLVQQLIIMSVAMVSIGTLFDGLYAVLAGRARVWLADPDRQRLQARITGSLLIATGIGLLLVRRA